MPYHYNRRGFLRFSTSALLAARLSRTSSADGAEPATPPPPPTPNESNMPANLDSVKALTFDVFGTVVDWRSSIIREGQELARRKGLDVDWAKFADAWRGGYGPSMNRVRGGELPWMKIDDLHRLILDGLLRTVQHRRTERS